jgi:hypothetical protein
VKPARFLSKLAANEHEEIFTTRQRCTAADQRQTTELHPNSYQASQVLIMPLTKRQKTEAHHTDEDDDNVIAQTSGEEDLQKQISDDQSSSDGESSPGTEDEIANAKNTKSKKTLKRKRRATEPSNFGATLNALLNTEAPSSLPLSLKPSVSRKRNDEKLELKARKVLRVEKKEKQDKRRIKDVIGGWGGEGERALRKVAQRGGTFNRVLLLQRLIPRSVVRLFNVIQQSQSAASAAAQDVKNLRGTGKPTLPAPTFDQVDNKKKGKHKDNSLGRGKEGKGKLHLLCYSLTQYF